MGGADLMRRRALGRMTGKERDLGPGIPRQLRGQKTDDPTAKDEDPLAGDRRAKVQPVQRAGQRFGEGGVVRMQVRDHNSTVCGDRGPLGKSAVAVDADGNVPGAEVHPTAQALVAGSASDVRIAGDAGAEGQGDALSPTDDLAREFVAQGDRRGAGKLALVKVPVSAADACRLDLDQHLAGTGGGVGDLCQFDPANRLQPDCAHCLPSHHGAEDGMQQAACRGCCALPNSQRQTRRLSGGRGRPI